MELIYTWPQLKAVQDRIKSIEQETDAITDRTISERRAKTEEERLRYNALWHERHELEKQRDIMRKECIPEVGMPCTVHWYSDRSGATIKEVIGKTKKKVVVKCDGTYSCTKVFTYRRNGHWVEEGTTSRDWGTLLSLGYKSNYLDPSF